MQGIKNWWAPSTLFKIAIAYSVLITIAFLLPSKEVDPIPIKNFDKALHIAIYAVLVFLWLFYFFSKQKQNKLSTTAATVFCLLVYGIIIEVLQYIVTASRKADIFDLFANAIGIVIGLVLFYIISVKISKRL